MIDILDEHFTDQINYYHDLQDSLEELMIERCNGCLKQYWLWICRNHVICAIS